MGSLSAHLPWAFRRLISEGAGHASIWTLSRMLTATRLRIIEFMSRSARQYHHGDLAAALELAAIELLGETSASSLSLREVARRAGVSHNAPYHHFSDRQSLLQAIAARSLEDLNHCLAAARDGAATPRDKLVAVGAAYIDFAIDHAGQFGTIFDTEIYDPRAPNPVTGPLTGANYELLADTVRAAFPGEAEEEIPAIAAGLWGLVHGLANLISTGHLPRDVVEHSLNALLDMRLGDE